MAIECNVGVLDRRIRLAIGAIFLVIGIGAEVGILTKGVLFLLAAVGFVTGFAQFCPLWALFGVNTCKVEK
jgi:hypothetical protein